MKKLLCLSVVALMALPALAGSASKTTTTTTYEETSSTPAAMSSESDMIEAQEDYDEPLSIEEADETRMEEPEKMEETVIESEEAIDYSDRTRTNRERKALNTGSNASDDN